MSNSMNEDKDGKITDIDYEQKDPYEGMNRAQRRKAMKRDKRVAGRQRAKQNELMQRRAKK